MNTFYWMTRVNLLKILLKLVSQLSIYLLHKAANHKIIMKDILLSYRITVDWRTGFNLDSFWKIILDRRWLKVIIRQISLRKGQLGKKLIKKGIIWTVLKESLIWKIKTIAILGPNWKALWTKLQEKTIQKVNQDKR